MAKPAIAAPICDLVRIKPDSKSDIVEVYNVKNMPVLTQQPFDLTKLPAFYDNIGQVPRMLTNFTWTTPYKNPPQYVPGAPFQYAPPSYVYNPFDDLGLVTATTNGGISGGLVATKGNVSKQVIVGNCDNVYKSYKDLLYYMYTKEKSIDAKTYLNYLNSANLPDVYGLGTYRIILKEATTAVDKRATDVEIDFWEREYSQKNVPTVNDITSFPAHVQYELKYVPPSGSNLTEMTTILDKSRIEFKDGKLLLKKLLIGEYHLTAKTEWGSPYRQLPAVHFKLAPETINGVDVISVSLPNPTPFVYVTSKSDPLTGNQGAGVPTFFPGQLQNPDLNSDRIGKLRVFYDKNNRVGIAVHGTGLWQGHNTPSFSFRIEGVSGEGQGLKYYDYVSMEATKPYETYKTFTQDSVLELNGLPDGKYKISIVEPSLRTIPMTPQNVPDEKVKYVEVKNGVLTNTKVDFYFTYGNDILGKTDAAYAYLSGEMASENEFIVSK